MMIFLRSLLFFVCYVFYTLTIGTLSVLFCLLFWPVLGFKGRYRIIISWIDVIMWMLKTICRINFSVNGQENIPNKPCVVMSNHQSTWETLYSYKIFFPQTTVLKRELLWIPIFGWGLAMLKPIAINRGKKQYALKTILKVAPKLINEGFWYVVYPEGTRIKPSERRDYASGSSLIASQNNFNVLPIAHNAGHCWPARSFLKYPGTITLTIGPVISSQHKKTREITQEAREWIQNQQDLLNNNSC